MSRYEVIEMKLVRGQWWPMPETIAEFDSLEDAFHDTAGANMIVSLEGYRDRWLFVPVIPPGGEPTRAWSVYPPGEYWNTPDRSGGATVDDEFQRIVGGIR